jgi:FHS family glucose/mannose:H+ symporter-like MFS transporter
VPVVATDAALARRLTVAAYISFVPIGIATVLLGPMLPTLSTRWGLNYSQAGALFTAQYIASTCAVGLSGTVVAWRGFRFAIQSGLCLIALGLAVLLVGPRTIGVLCIAVYGAGLGISVPAANLMVAEMNPERRGATLNRLNFFWSAGAVACPFLIAAASKIHRVPFVLGAVSVTSLMLALGLSFTPTGLAGRREITSSHERIAPLITRRLRSFLALAALFFIYVGTENAFGGWVASFSKNLGTLRPVLALMTPSFFYGSLMFGRWLAPLLLRSTGEIRLAQAGLVLACGGSAGLLVSQGLAGVVSSACLAGLGLSSVYPITISLLSKESGAASSRVGSVMFVLSNIGGGLLPWVVGIVSNHAGSIKTGLIVPLIGCATMLTLYLPRWNSEAAPMPD